MTTKTRGVSDIGKGFNWYLIAFVTRPTHQLVFDRLQYAKTEGKAWYIYHGYKEGEGILE